MLILPLLEILTHLWFPSHLSLTWLAGVARLWHWERRDGGVPYQTLRGHLLRGSVCLWTFLQGV